jgi:hypothetical protein
VTADDQRLIGPALLLLSTANPPVHTREIVPPTPNVSSFCAVQSEPCHGSFRRAATKFVTRLGDP